MKVIIFGATGMVGQGVLRECLLASDVERVLIIGRTAAKQRHVKVQEIIRADLLHYEDIDPQLAGYDACFFCLGVSAFRMSEEQYSRITYDITMAAASTLARLNPKMTFIYVSGAGTDSTEHGRMMWARVKGRTENDLLRLPLNAYMFRPAFIQALHGVESKTPMYRWLYPLMVPLLPLLKRLPRYATTTEQVGRAMLNVARAGAPKRVLESADINRL